MNTLQLIAILLDGLNYAAWLFIVAVGLTLIYGVMRILNIAHGAFYAIGAYACASAIGVFYAAGFSGALVFLAMGLVALVVVWSWGFWWNAAFYVFSMDGTKCCWFW